MPRKKRFWSQEEVEELSEENPHVTGTHEQRAEQFERERRTQNRQLRKPRGESSEQGDQ